MITRLCFKMCLVLMLLFTFIKNVYGIDYFPLSPGNKWEYIVETNQYGIISEKGNMVRRIEGTKMINNIEYIHEVRVKSGISYSHPITRYYRKSAEGIYVIEGDDPRKREIWLIRYPLEVGKSWSVSYYNGITLNYKIDAIESAVLFTKTYDNCLKISFNFMSGNHEFEGYIYYAPAVGFIKMFRIDKTNGTVYKEELINYK